MTIQLNQKEGTRQKQTITQVLLIAVSFLTNGGIKMFGSNPYSPYGYNFMPQQIPQQMGMQSQYQQPTQQAPQNQSPALLQVSTTKQVEQVTVQPGSKALVLVQNEPVIAMRTADQMGLVQTDYYRIEKFDPAQAVQPVPQQDYVTRAEFEQTIQNLLNNINKPAKQTK